MESQVHGVPGAIGPNNPAPTALPLSGLSSPDPWDQHQARGGGPNMVVIIVAGAALLIAAGGMIKSLMSPKAEAPAPVAAAPSYFSEQTQMMREAMNMAREAQQMQRERMEMVRQEMETAEGGYGGESGSEMGMEDAGDR
jgi:hypothetical protein